MVGVASGSLQVAYGQLKVGLTAWVAWPGLRVGGCLAPFHIHHMKWVNSCTGSSYDDSIKSIFSLIIIIIVVVVLLLLFSSSLFSGDSDNFALRHNGQSRTLFC